MAGAEMKGHNPMNTPDGILSLIDKLLTEATSVEEDTLFVSSRLRNDIIVPVLLSYEEKEQIKERRLSVRYYRKIRDMMNEKNATKRNLAFQILIPILFHSAKARYLFVNDLHEMTDRVFGIRTPLPGPEASSLDLKNRFLEVIEILANKYGDVYPHFSVCYQFLKDQLRQERRNEKRMLPPKAASASTSKKKRSMEVLQEVVNEVVWTLLKEMEQLDSELVVALETDDPPDTFLSLDEILDASWSEYDYTLDVPRGPSQAELQQKQKREEAMQKLYADLTEHYKSLTDELIPTLERNQTLLLSRDTPKAQANLEKVDDLLDRCRITAKRCKQLVYRYRERYAPRENSLYTCLFALDKEFGGNKDERTLNSCIA